MHVTVAFTQKPVQRLLNVKLCFVVLNNSTKFHQNLFIHSKVILWKQLEDGQMNKHNKNNKIWW
jgi:hypothetical protein